MKHFNQEQQCAKLGQGVVHSIKIIEKQEIKLVTCGFPRVEGTHAVSYCICYSWCMLCLVIVKIFVHDNFSSKGSMYLEYTRSFCIMRLYVCAHANTHNTLRVHYYAYVGPSLKLVWVFPLWDD